MIKPLKTKVKKTHYTKRLGYRSNIFKGCSKPADIYIPSIYTLYPNINEINIICGFITAFYVNDNILL